MKRRLVDIAEIGLLFAGAIGFLLAAAGCAGSVDAGPGSAVEPLGAATDRADRACNVVMRDASRLVDARGVGFAVTVQLSGNFADKGATANVLYLSSDGGGWQEVAAGPDGVARFSSQGGAQAIAFARLTDGSRVFDHNRFQGPLDDAVLYAQPGWTLPPVGLCGGAPPDAKLDFQVGYVQVQRGAIVRGGKLDIDYALSRLTTCRDTHNGFRFWSMDAFVKFDPGGQLTTGTVVASNGFDIMPATYTVDVPLDAEKVEIWFRNATPPSCEGWDSNYGANYVFPVIQGSPSQIQWVGDLGSSTDRACQHNAGVAEPIVIDEYMRERACIFVDADVWAPGVTGSHPEWVFARAEWAKDTNPSTFQWLEPQGGVGNNQRFRFQAPYEIRNLSDWTTASYTLEFSTDGNDWISSPTHTFQRAF
jgi:hypothetical protein